MIYKILKYKIQMTPNKNKREYQDDKLQFTSHFF